MMSWASDALGLAMGIDPAVLLLFLSPGWGAAFTQCRLGVFKVNVHFVQVFIFFCSLLFSFELAVFCFFILKALGRSSLAFFMDWHDCRYRKDHYECFPMNSAERTP